MRRALVISACSAKNATCSAQWSMQTAFTNFFTKDNRTGPIASHQAKEAEIVRWHKMNAVLVMGCIVAALLVTVACACVGRTPQHHQQEKAEEGFAEPTKNPSDRK